MFILTRLYVCRTLLRSSSVGPWLSPFTSSLNSHKVWGGLHPLSSFLCLFAPSLELRKVESQSLSKLSLPWCVTSITEAERLWVRINTTLNLYTLLSNSLYLLSPTVCSVLIQCQFHLINREYRLTTHFSITSPPFCS